MEERGVGAALTLILRLASGQLIGGLTAAAVHAGGSRAIVAISRLSCGHLDFGVEGVVVVALQGVADHWTGSGARKSRAWVS